jgi:hypothetical protein
MASTIKVNNIQNQCGANIANKCGSTVTLGASGDTITLACGASQTGFGRTGTVDWDTTAKTASFTAVSGNGYFVNTTSGAITVTMPASPSAGDIVGIKDYAGTFATNNVTVGRNGSLFDGASSDPILETDQLSVFFVYVDATQGWKATQSDSGEYGALYITATGGTITTCGNYKIHTFTGPGTFTVCSVGNSSGSNTVSYLVLAGGGAGGAHTGAGGGAGGFRESKASSDCYSASPLNATSGPTYNLPVSASPYPITVGAGGSGAPNAKGGNGSSSIFSTITSAGGGGGGGSFPSTQSAGNGGSGGGGGGQGGFTGGIGNTPPVSPPQGNTGGDSVPDYATGGGGGATAAGANGTPGGAGPGGNGATSSINGTPTARAGGGGGSDDNNPNGTGGTGGGTPGVTTGSATAAADNTGSGGGGTHASGPVTGGTGGSGIVIIRYKYQ